MPKATSKYRVNVVIERDKDGYFAYVPELKGCHSQGETLDEVMANIREATELYLETISPARRKELLSRETVNASIEVQVA